MEYTQRGKRKASLARRLAQENPDGRKHCWVFGCKVPPGNVSGRGLGRFCRKHLEHHRRHGDPLRRSLRANEVAPYRAAAVAWIKSKSSDRYVTHSLAQLECLMKAGGSPIAANRLRGLSAKQRANAVWARLRDRELRPAAVLAAILSAALCHHLDPQRGSKEYRRVQIGKLLNRMGGGTTKRWETHATDRSGNKVLRWFAPSEGLVLRELGIAAEKAVEFLIPDRLDEVLKHGAQRRTSRAMKNLPYKAVSGA